MAAPIVVLDQVDSTNSEAMRRAASGESGPIWLMARRQTVGRGRSGRGWTSGEGNLAATLLFAPGCTMAELHQLSLVAGVAVIDGVRAIAPVEPTPTRFRLKWPNDILLDTEKLGGILVESTSRGSIAVAAIGVGVNVAHAPTLEARRTACLSAAGIVTDPDTLLGSISQAASHWLDLWDAGRGFAAVRAAWLERAGPPGERVSVNTGNETIYGAFAGIDETGALLVDSVPPKSGHRRRLTFGDVSLAATEDGIGLE